MKLPWIPCWLALAHLATCVPLQLAADEPLAPVIDSRKLARATELSEAFKEIARLSRPSVVSITSVKRVAVRQTPERQPSRMPEEFREFFDEEFFERYFGSRTPQGGFEQRGRGSGVIVREDGYILTNNHLIGDADEVTVTLADKRQMSGKVVGADKPTDLAVLKIEATGLPVARLGDSSQIEAGEWVLAIGSPFGLEQTVTAGIISAKGRARVGITDYEDFLQTDAAINPGNSGGPLVNLKGEVIGINTAIASRTGGYMGISFAIPSHQAREVMQSILKEGRVTRGRLGAVIQNLTSELAESFRFSSKAGVLVSDVTPQSPADQAGLRAGDIVVRFNGQPMADASQLRNAVAAAAPKTEVELEIFREGNPKKVKVTIGLLEDDSPVASAKVNEKSAAQLGLTVETLTPALARQFGIANERGVVITKVESNSLAERAGIRAGDVLLAVGDRSVDNVADFNEAVRDINLALGVRLQLKSDGVRRFVFLRATKP